MRKSNFYIILICLIQFNSGAVAQTVPELLLPDTLDGVVRLDVSSIPDQEREADLLMVFVENEAETYVSNAVQGRYTRVGDYLNFEPYFPFEAGLTYVAKVRTSHSENPYNYRRFQIGEKRAVEEAKVLSIFPSASELPENVLRFYIHFNSPMRKGQSLRYIQLVDSNGNIDGQAFMEFKQELWSTDGKRLTILLDPGRIKRGVATNRSLGPALLEGKSYTLSISGDWTDVYGQALSGDITKEIVVVSPYRRQMEVNEWALDLPSSNSQDTLSIHFDRILDYALIQSMIQIEDEEGNLLDGHWEVFEHEQLIQFIPRGNWRKGNYRIVVDSRLEDVAGNSLQNLLDHLETDGGNSEAPYQVVEFKL